MIDANKRITISGENALDVFSEVEFMLISLHNMGSYYIDKPVEEYQRATTEFIDNFRITRRLAKIRRILKKSFDNTRGSDDMTDIERHLQSVRFWEPEKPVATTILSADKNDLS